MTRQQRDRAADDAAYAKIAVGGLSRCNGRVGHDRSLQRARAGSRQDCAEQRHGSLDARYHEYSDRVGPLVPIRSARSAIRAWAIEPKASLSPTCYECAMALESRRFRRV